MRLIDEKEALEKINEIPDRQMNGVTVAKALAQCKTIEAEPVRYGKWVKLGQRTYGGGRNYTHYCSECGEHGFDDYRRCHGCGARMDGEKYDT